MFETKKDYNETEMRTLIELLYGSIAMREQALSSKNFLWGILLNWPLQSTNLKICKFSFEGNLSLFPALDFFVEYSLYKSDIATNLNSVQAALATEEQAHA